MKDKKQQSGQALVSLLIFMVIATIILSAAIVGVLLSATTTLKAQLGNQAYSVAESGAENGVLRLLRDPTYTGEVMLINEATATITVTGTNPLILISVGKVGNFTRKIQVTVQNTNTILSVLSWKEI